MPLTRLIADALGVVTISLVCLLVLLGLLCLLYSLYFRYQINKQGVTQLGYFNKPWFIRITFILFAIWWGFGEIVRLSFLRHRESVVNAFDPKWQEAVCKFYIISNLGFAEPCLFLTISFLLRAALLKQRDFRSPCHNWNVKTAFYILLICLPLFVVQAVIVLAGARIKDKSHVWNMPHYFTSIAIPTKTDHDINIALCTYPLLNTIILGLYTTAISLYLSLLGRRMVSSVINRGLRRRVFFLIVSVSSFFPVRVVLLGLSVLSRPEHVLFEALIFPAFLCLLSCAGVGICLLVYCPVADSLALKGPRDLETGRRPSDNHHDAISLIGNQSLPEASPTTSVGRNSDESTKRGSISFRTMLKDETSAEVYEELSLFSSLTHHIASPPGSPQLPGRPMYQSNSEY